MVSFPEREWRLLRSLHRAALDRYCARVLEECAAVVRDVTKSPHDRYLRLFKLLREREDDIAAAFDDLKRSTALQHLAAMVALGVVTDDELNEFNTATRESATGLAKVLRESTRRRRAPSGTHEREA